MQNAATATGNGSAARPVVSISSYQMLTIQVTGISGDTITMEGTIDGTNWYAIEFMDMADSTALATTITANGIFRADVTGLEQVRARISTYSAGTITVIGRLVA